MNNYELKNNRRIVYYKLKNNYISKDDINYLNECSFIDIENLVNKPILFNIYIHPYILCNDYMFQDGILFLDLTDIGPLLIKRYNNEISELYLKFNDGDISLLEYEHYKEELDYLYFESSMIGRRIYHYYNDKILCISLDRQKKYEK